MAAMIKKRWVCELIKIHLMLVLFASVANAQETSALWGENGELWDPGNSMLSDFTTSGYKGGAEPIPLWLDGGAPPSSYDVWAAGHGVGAAANDSGSDGVNNLTEYAMGGNPTNRLVRGTLPTFTKVGNLFRYVYPRRSDDSTITYTVETTTNLMSGSWTKTDYTMTGTNITGGTLDFVTNEVDAVEDEKFIRLKIEQ